MRLHIFTEGIDDTKFFKKFIECCLTNYDKFQYFEYSEMPDNQVISAIKTVIEQENTDLILVGDFDFRDKNKFNIEDKKKELVAKWKLPNSDNIFIAINEIESWYLAGFNDRFCKGNHNTNRTKIKNSIDTQLITKEFFQHSSNKSQRNLINYLLRKNRYYDYNEAKKRNNSFKRFFNKLKLSC